MTALKPQRLPDKHSEDQEIHFLTTRSHVPSSSGRCPLGFSLSSFGLPISGWERADEDGADVEGAVEEAWWWEGRTLFRLISLRTSLMVFLSSLSRLLREGLDFMAQVMSNFSSSCCSCLSRGRFPRLAGTSRRSTEERVETHFMNIPLPESGDACRSHTHRRGCRTHRPPKKRLVVL